MIDVLAPLSSAVAALLLCCSGADAWAVCNADAGAAGSASWETVAIAGAPGDLEGGYFLGHGGERVLARTDIDLVIAGGKVSVQQPWPERVDWAPYGKLKANEPGTYFRFDRDAANARRLCRIDEMSYETNQDGELTGHVVAKTYRRFQYGTGDRLTEVVEPYSDDTTISTCYLYDAAGRPTGRVVQTDASCADARLEQAPTIYLYRQDGRLQRTLTVNQGEGGGESGQPLAGRVTTVQTYDADGVAASRYCRDRDGRPYQVAPSAAVGADDLRCYHDPIVMLGEDWQVILVDEQWAKKGHRITWQFVRIGETAAADEMAASETAAVETIGQGKTNRRGETTLTRPQQRKLFQRITQYPGRVMLRVPEVGVTGIPVVPPTPADRWSACVDPARNEPGACE